jgi:riboflavin kinase/FMN adenylyltransferase
MTVVRFPVDALPFLDRPPVAALGNFDGLHRGHVKIVERVIRQARERGAQAYVLTFDPHPPRIVRPDKAPPLLMTLEQRLEALARTGIDGVAIVTFTPELSRWTPEIFVERVLVNWLRVGEVWVGANFLFGHQRAGNFSLLRLLGEQHGFGVEKIDPVRYKEFVVSSTRIRRLLDEGRVDEAAALLGHHYAVDGEVVRGDGRGRTIGFPTANLCSPNELLPADGVYLTLLRYETAWLPSLTNIGVRPTIGEGLPRTLETHLLDGVHDLYGRHVRVCFVERLRGERAFDGLEALKAQIAADVAGARERFGSLSL